MYDIILIGGSGGIGNAILEKFSSNNRIFATSNKTQIDLSQICYDNKQNIETYNVDIKNVSSQQWFINNIKDKLTKPVLIYTPGISINNSVTKYNLSDWEETIAINLTGAFTMTQMVLPIMKELNFGRIIYMSSVLSKIAVPGTCAYSVTKAGLNSLARSVAIENAKYNITANSIALGYTELGIINAVPKEFLEKNVIPKIPKQKLGNADNICSTIDYLIENDYVTGTSIDVNGGLC